MIEAKKLLLIISLGLLIYTNSLNNSFHYDDIHSIVDNPNIRHLENIPLFFTSPEMFSAFPGAAMYRPLLLTTYALNYAIHGTHVIGYRLINLAIHIATAYLVYRCVTLLVADSTLGLIASLFFLVHPLSTESVNFISSRSESLAVFFYLSSFWCYEYSRRRATASLASRPLLYALSLITYIASLLTKEIGITLPGILLLRDLLMRRFSLKAYIPFGIVSLLYFYLSLGLIKPPLVDEPLRSLSVQFFTQTKALVYYSTLLFFPAKLNIEHQFFISRQLSDPAVYTSLAMLASLFLVLLSFGRHRPQLLFWVGWPALAILPTFVVPLNILVMERRLYLPLISFCALCAWGLKQFLLDETHPASRNSGKMAVLLMCCWGALSMDRNTHWRDERAIWTDALHKSPLMAKPYNNLGKTYYAEGNLAEAERLFEKAESIDPTLPEIPYNLGTLYKQLGKPDLALREFQNALSLKPDYVSAYNNLGNLYLSLNQPQKALESFQSALKYAYADSEVVYFNLGVLFQQQGQYEEAKRFFQTALQLRPGYSQARNNLANLLRAQGLLSEAEREYRRCLDDNPKLKEAHYGLGATLALLGQSQEADQSLRFAVSLDPSYIESWLALGDLLANAGQSTAALEALKLAIVQNPQSAKLYTAIGLISRKFGDMGTAEQAYLTAIKLDSTFAQAFYNLGNLYRQQEKYPQALGAYQRAIKVSTTFAEAYNNLGVTYGKLGRSPDALNAYKQAIRLLPSYRDAYYNLTLAYVALRMPQQAIDTYKQCAALWSGNPESLAKLRAQVARLSQNRLDQEK